MTICYICNCNPPALLTLQFNTYVKLSRLKSAALTIQNVPFEKSIQLDLKVIEHKAEKKNTKGTFTAQTALTFN